MKRFLIAAVMAASFVSISSALTFEVGINGGYGLGLGDSVGSNYSFDAMGNPTKWEDVYGSMGNGFKAMLDFSCYLNESFGIIAMSSYSGKIFGKIGGGYSTQYDWSTWGSRTKVETSYLSINLGLKVRGTAILGSIRPYAYFAPGIYLPTRTDTVSYTGAMADPDDHVTYKFALGLGFTAGVGAMMDIIKLGESSIGVKLEVNPTYAYANIKEYTYTQVSTGPSTSQRTVVFQNDNKALPPTAGSTSYQHGQPRYRFNSLAVKLGGYITF